MKILIAALFALIPDTKKKAVIAALIAAAAVLTFARDAVVEVLKAIGGV